MQTGSTIAHGSLNEKDADSPRVEQLPNTDRRPLTPEQFVLRAIETLRDPERSRGIHTVFSGFNNAFREYFPGLDPVDVTNQLAEAGRIAIRPARRGVMIYKPGEAPGAAAVTDVLKKILQDPNSE